MKLKFLSLLLVIFNIFSCVTYAEDDSSLNVTKTTDSIEIDSDAKSDDYILSSAGEDKEVTSTSQDETVDSPQEESTNEETKEETYGNKTRKQIEDVRQQLIANLSKQKIADINVARVYVGDYRYYGKNVDSYIYDNLICLYNTLFDLMRTVVVGDLPDVTIGGEEIGGFGIDLQYKRTGETSKNPQLGISLNENYISINNMMDYDFESFMFIINDCSELDKLFRKIDSQGIAGLEKEHKDYTGNFDNYTKIDKMDFTFIMPADFKGDFTDRIADIGTEVNCEYTHYNYGRSRDDFVLTLKGNKGEYSWYHTTSRQTLSGTGYFPSSNLPVEFPYWMRVVNGNRMIGSVIDSMYDYPYLKVEFEGSTPKSIQLSVILFTDKPVKFIVCENPYIVKDVLQNNQVTKQGEEMKNAVSCENITYTVFEDYDYMLTDKSKDYDKEEERLKVEEYGNVEQQDLERYVTMLKGKTDKGREFTYKINFLAEVPVSYNGQALPTWYKNLGDDVKVTIMSYTLSRDGKSFNLEEFMMRFKGSKGEEWFEYVELTDESSNSKSKTKTMAYDSLISFDGSIKVKNTIEHETISAKMEFENNDRDDLKSISINIGTASINVDIDEFKYIGGGKIVYDKIW